MGYNKSDKIIGSENNFENLRAKIQTLINTRKAATGLGKSDFDNYTSPADINTAITSSQEKINEKSNASPFVNGIKVIQDLLQQGYMKPMGNPTQQAAAQRIKDSNPLNKNSVIPALTDFYDVVNYWNNGTNDSSTGCNGACTGYCDGSCANNTTKGTVEYPTNSQGQQGMYGCPSCSGECTDSCGTTGCDARCKGLCKTTCTTYCSENCATSCKTSCVSALCREGCNTQCGFKCQEGCYGECNTVCSSGCGNDCDIGCAGGCGGNCKDGCANTCKTGGCGSGCDAACGASCSGQTAIA